MRVTVPWARCAVRIDLIISWVPAMLSAIKFVASAIATVSALGSRTAN